jgi:hypothetical protein
MSKPIPESGFYREDAEERYYQRVGDYMSRGEDLVARYKEEEFTFYVDKNGLHIQKVSGGDILVTQSSKDSIRIN